MIHSAERPGVIGGKIGSMAHSEFGTAAQAVKNAPYQAEALSETVQVLSDGNRITRRSSSTVARDSQGRTRRDINVAGIGAKITVIHDPVANVSYTLEHENKIARKMKGQGMMIHWESRDGAGAAQRVPADVIMVNRKVEGPQHDVLMEGGPQAFHVRLRSKDNGKTESLGKQTVNGVAAEGTRVTNVIPAGEIGNERPIEIVFERWYSPELQTLVSSTHKDPMIGESTYKLVNLTRAEPLPSMFEVPAGYTVKEH